MQPLWKTIWGFLKKLKIRFTIWSSYPTPQHIPRQNYNLKRYMHPYVHSSFIYTIAMTWKQPKCPSIDEWIKKMWYTRAHTHTHNGILLSHKKEWNGVICSNIDGRREDHTKQSRSERERQIPYDDIHGIQNMTQMNLSTKQKQTHRHRE